MADLHSRLRTRNQNQLASIDFTPTAGVPIPELNEINGTVKLAPPVTRPHFVLPGIDLHERTGADQGIKRVVLQADVSTKTFPQIQLLQERDRDVAPSFKHTRDQIRSRKLDILAKFERQHNRVSWRLQTRPNQVSVWQTDQSLFLGDIQDIDPEKAHDLQIAAPVDETQAVELVDARSKLSILDIGKPAVGNVIVLVIFLLGNLQ